MEPFRDWHSSWYLAYWDVYRSTPYSEVRRSVHYNLWRRFDHSFITKDK